MNNLADELLELIKKDYDNEVSKSKTLQQILKKTKEGTADYADSLLFAKEIGICLEKAFSNNISDEILPDSKLYYDLAKALIEPMSKDSFKTISSHCSSVQTLLNKKAKIGLKAIEAEYNEEKTEGVIKYISNANKYSDREKSFLDSLSTNAKSVVDESVRKNAEFHYNSGLSPKIIRTSVGKTCKWCQSLAGVYEYKDVKNKGNDVFKRHANCDCTVVYDPQNGSKRVQDVWSKSWNENSKLDKVQRKIERIQRETTITLPNGIEDVTKIYLSEATPGKGKIEIDSGIDVKNNKEDIKVAKWLRDTFGGKIRVVKALNKYKEGTPDYIWNNKQWELKSPSSKNAIDKRMQKAGHQLGEKGGGMVIDVTNVRGLSEQEIAEFIAEKLPKRAKGNIDLIIVKDAKLINVMRYKKK